MRQFPALACAAIAAAAGTIHAQSVEFRIVERQGQTIIPVPAGATPTTDAVLNYAVQARVLGGTADQFLGTFSFDIVAPGEADSSGTLTRLLTSNADGTYAANTAQANSSTIGRGGLAAIYTYLAGIGPTFNGIINASGGTFTNTPGNQEIGLVTGAPIGNSLLLLADGNGDGNPDTYPGTGTTAPIDPTIASTYLGAGGSFVDVYRFKYTVSNLVDPRLITFTLANLTAQIGSDGLAFSNGAWGPASQHNAATTLTNSTVIVLFPAPGAGAAFMLGCGWAGARRRRP
jgi:hypothetical protein